MFKNKELKNKISELLDIVITQEQEIIYLNQHINNMPCKPLKKILNYNIDIETELYFEYQKLQLMNFPKKYLKGYKNCMNYTIKMINEIKK